MNTSNVGKLEEYREYLGPDVKALHQDVKEPLADPLTVIQYKASQFSQVIVDDVSLDIENENVGSLIKWHLEELPRWIGKRAVFVCRLGFHKNNEIFVYTGELEGQIVNPRGQSFGFNPYFLPDGSAFTLGEKKEAQFNARYYAIQNLLNDKPSHRLPLLKEWADAFQNET